MNTTHARGLTPRTEALALQPPPKELELHYRGTVFQRLSSRNAALLATDLRVEVAQPLDWVRQHADEIAALGVNQARFGRPVALWIEKQESTEERA